MQNIIYQQSTDNISKCFEAINLKELDGKTMDGRRVRVEFTRDSRWADSGSRYGRGKVLSKSFFLGKASFYLTKKNN